MHEQISARDNVVLDAYAYDDLREHHENFHSINPAVQAELIRDWRSQGELEPIETISERNITTVGLNQTVVRNLDPNTPSPEIKQLAIGEGASVLPATTDTTLEAEADRLPITQIQASAGRLETVTVISTTQANGVTIRELGLIASPDALLNRAHIPPYTKSPSAALVVSVIFEFASADAGGTV